MASVIYSILQLLFPNVPLIEAYQMAPHTYRFLVSGYPLEALRFPRSSHDANKALPSCVGLHSIRRVFAFKVI